MGRIAIRDVRMQVRRKHAWAVMGTHMNRSRACTLAGTRSDSNGCAAIRAYCRAQQCAVCGAWPFVHTCTHVDVVVCSFRTLSIAACAARNDQKSSAELQRSCGTN
jgi:hypothetical protein